MAKIDDLLAATNRYMTASTAKAAADAKTISADEATIAEDHATITDLQNHQVDDALVAKFNDAAAVLEAGLAPADAPAATSADPAPPATVPVTVINPDGTPGLTTSIPAPVTPAQVGDVVAVPVAAPLDTNAPIDAPAPAPVTLDHTVTLVDPATGALTAVPVDGAVPTTPAAAGTM